MGSEHEEERIDVARETRRRISFLLKKPIIEQRDVYILTKRFFSAYIEEERELTIEELRLKLHEIYLSSIIREKIEAILALLGPMEYMSVDYNQDKLRTVLETLKNIIRDLVREEKRRLPLLTRFANWLFRRKPKAQEVIISEYPANEESEPFTVELNILLEEIYNALDKGKVRSATRIYQKLLQRYNQLGNSVQRRFYHKLNSAYETIAKR